MIFERNQQISFVFQNSSTTIQKRTEDQTNQATDFIIAYFNVDKAKWTGEILINRFKYNPPN
jgi:hypothetical protein